MERVNADPNASVGEQLIPMVTCTTSSTTTTPTERRLFTLEPPIFLLYYAWNVESAVLIDQIVYQACTVSLGINQTECSLLGKGHESTEVHALEERVQPYSANIIMVEALSDSIIPAVLNMFIGSWSDRYGRKPVLALTFGGTFLSLLFITAICFLSSHYMIDPWFYTVAFIPSTLCGAVCTLMTTVYCYIADVTSMEDRGTKMARLQMSQYAGRVLGGVSSSYILRKTNATTIFVIATTCLLLALLYILIVVKESVPVEGNPQSGCCSKLRNLFRSSLVSDTFRSGFKSRPNYCRATILVGVLALGGKMFASEDVHTVFFLFLRNRFNWTVRKYTLYTATETICMLVGNFVGSYGLQKTLGRSEAAIASIGFFCSCLNSITIAVAFQSWHLYLGVIACMLKGVADPMTRAFISNTVSSEEMGKIFAFSSTFEALMPLLGAPVYTSVYKRTLAWYPAAYSWISAGVYTLCCCLTMSVCILQLMLRNSNTTIEVG